MNHILVSYVLKKRELNCHCHLFTQRIAGRYLCAQWWHLYCCVECAIINQSPSKKRLTEVFLIIRKRIFAKLHRVTAATFVACKHFSFGFHLHCYKWIVKIISIIGTKNTEWQYLNSNAHSSNIISIVDWNRPLRQRVRVLEGLAFVFVSLSSPLTIKLFIEVLILAAQLQRASDWKKTLSRSLHYKKWCYILQKSFVLASHIEKVRSEKKNFPQQENYKFSWRNVKKYNFIVLNLQFATIASSSTSYHFLLLSSRV